MPKTIPGIQISALFVQKDGCYIDVDNIDVWPEERDARLYTGNNPVIAHPPCQLWGKMAALNWSQYGGDHNKPGNDGGCFQSAVTSVIRCGGVVEHPAQTNAWKAHGIEKPTKGQWTAYGYYWVCEVWQSAYGHRANKATWLYYIGNKKPFDLNWDRSQGTHKVGGPDKRWTGKPTISKKEANATPDAFRAVLIKLVEHSRS